MKPTALLISLIIVAGAFAGCLDSVARIAILDERGLRTIEDYEWVHGNAEHAWGILH